jgi:hypothetical protein
MGFSLANNLYSSACQHVLSFSLQHMRKHSSWTFMQIISMSIKRGKVIMFQDVECFNQWQEQALREHKYNPCMNMIIEEFVMKRSNKIILSDYQNLGY